jgi:hypothetical protein
MDTGPIGRLVHPRLYFWNGAFSLALRVLTPLRD